MIFLKYGDIATNVLKVEFDWSNKNNISTY